MPCDGKARHVWAAGMNGACPVCESTKLSSLLVLRELPVFCNVQFASKAEAMDQPTGSLNFTQCAGCGHFFNSEFNEELLSYGQSYENSLHFSATFGRFAEGVAQRLVSQYGLNRKRVLDIGCGKGDFLSMLCELGDNIGFGFDKSFEDDRARSPQRGSVQYFKKYFTSEDGGLHPDLVTCRHVLEHMPQPIGFLRGIADALAESPGCAVYFEVPNAAFTVRDLGIWDLIYEHCQYFTAGSLATAFVGAGFCVSEIAETFGGQYLSLDGTLAADGPHAPRHDTGLPAEGCDGSGFREEFERLAQKWRNRIRELNGRIVIWGAGSKGVTFLNLLSLREEIECIVDINPHKHGRFVPVTGHEIVGPDALQALKPDHVLVMNPLYKDEIAGQLLSLGVKAAVDVVE